MSYRPQRCGPSRCPPAVIGDGPRQQSVRGRPKGVKDQPVSRRGRPTKLPRILSAEKFIAGQTERKRAGKHRVRQDLPRRELRVVRIVSTLDEVMRPVMLEAIVKGNGNAVEAKER